MSVTKEKSNRSLKTTIIVLGILLIAAGITPYINAYLLPNKNIQIIEAFIEPMFSDTSEIKSITLGENIANNTEDNKQESKLNNKLNSKLNNKIDNFTDESEQNDNNMVSIETKKEPLPSLHDSDSFFLNKIKKSSAQPLFIQLDIIRNMVVFIDNFSRGILVNNFNPLKRPEQKFSVIKKNKIEVINSNSYSRYDKYAQAINEINAQQFINLYVFCMPLINEAYQEIGYPFGSFTKTFKIAIDHLLDTPIIQYELKVNSPSAMFQYADKNLESLPDSQKQLLRMGPDNLRIIKKKMQEIQNALLRL